MRSNLCRYCIVGFNKGLNVLAVIGCILKTISIGYMVQIYVPPYVDVVFWASVRDTEYLMKGDVY